MCDLSLPEVYRAEEMFCTGTMGEVVPVVEVDGGKIGTGTEGPLTARLKALFREIVRHSDDEVLV